MSHSTFINKFIKCVYSNSLIQALIFYAKVRLRVLQQEITDLEFADDFDDENEEEDDSEEDNNDRSFRNTRN